MRRGEFYFFLLTNNNVYDEHIRYWPRSWEGGIIPQKATLEIIIPRRQTNKVEGVS